jgi:hypothetical protein
MPINNPIIHKLIDNFYNLLYKLKILCQVLQK